MYTEIGVGRENTNVTSKEEIYKDRQWKNRLRKQRKRSGHGKIFIKCLILTCFMHVLEGAFAVN